MSCSSRARPLTSGSAAAAAIRAGEANAGGRAEGSATLPGSPSLHGPAHFRVTTETRRATAARAPPLTSGCHGARPSVPLPPGGARAPRPAAVPAARGGPAAPPLGGGGRDASPRPYLQAGAAQRGGGPRRAVRRARGRPGPQRRPPATGTARSGAARHGSGGAQRRAALLTRRCEVGAGLGPGRAGGAEDTRGGAGASRRA